MDLHAAFASTLDNHADAGTPTDGKLAPANGASSDMYASLMAKENNVLDLVRRVDETKRADALRDADQLAPLARAFFAGISGFLARLVHYASSGSTRELFGLLSSADGMIYAGTLLAVLGIVLMCL